MKRYVLLTIVGGGCCYLNTTQAHCGMPAFSNQTLSAGLDGAVQSPTGLGTFLAGGAVGDFNNDGWQDIFFAGGGGTPDRLYINNGDGTFSNQAASWGIGEMHQSSAAAVADYNKDGHLDIYVTSFGPPGSSAPGHHRLYTNMGDGSFVDRAEEANVNFSSPSFADGYGAAWGDYDLDGDLDLAVAGWSTSANGNRLFRNNGDATFTDATFAAELNGLSSVLGFAPRFADMNGDRYPELIWIGDFGSSIYYVNDGDGTFTDLTGPSGTSHDTTEMGVTVADWNEDGLFDFYVTTIGSNNLYINQGADVFLNVADIVGVAQTGWGWATAAVDFDHDSKWDILATSQGSGQYAFINETLDGESLSFSSVGSAIGFSSSVSGRGMSNFDYDNDGDQDAVVFPYNGALTLLRNDLSGNDINWLRVFLDTTGVDDLSANGIGSVVKIMVDDRTIMSRIDGGSNYLSQSELSAHFGISDVDIIDTLIVEWTNGDVTTVSNVSANQMLTISAASFDPADLNQDGHVGASDLAILLGSWGLCREPAACPADQDGNGMVGPADLAILLGHWD